MTRVLVVEDSATQAEELRLILESEGFVVETAPDGGKGLDRLTASRFELMISDIVMPGMSGYELCRAAKADPRTRDVPVLLLTTLSDPMDIIQGLECGADNFLTKPYDAGNLLKRVTGMLDNKLMRIEGKLKIGVEIFFLGKKFTISSDKEQILDLLLSTFEDIVRTNRDLQASQVDLAAAKAKIEEYAHKLEGRVRVSEEKYRSLMEHANDAIFVLDMQGRTLEVNRQTEKLLGRPASGIVGRPCFEFVIPAERDYAAVQFQKLLAEGSATVTDLHLQRGDAAFVCADFSVSLVQTNDTHIALAIARDVTERNRLQHQVLQNEKLATVGTLAAGIAHEINNPTAVILANMSVAKDYTGKVRKTLAEAGRLAEHAPEPIRKALEGLRGDPELEQSTAELEEVIRDCTHAGERIREIVRDLKGFARIDDGDVSLVSINESLDTTLRMAVNEIRRSAQVEKRLAPDLPQIVASPGKLSQVFLNLIVNAAQAIEEGKVEQNKISIATHFEDGRIRVDITDTGKGIPKDVLLKIFDPFFTTKPVGVGTGLGLSICEDIVKKHNGEIRVESEIGRGTTFSVFLPTATGLVLPRKDSPGEPAEVPRSKLMVVDDEPVLLRAYQRMLGGRHEVTTALGGRAAVELLSAAGASYDVIFCDLMMPDVDGVDLHRYVAEKFPGLDQRMIFISGGAFTQRARDFLARIEAPRLEKPFTLRDLHRAIGALPAKKAG